MNAECKQQHSLSTGALLLASKPSIQVVNFFQRFWQQAQALVYCITTTLTEQETRCKRLWGTLGITWTTMYPLNTIPYQYLPRGQGSRNRDTVDTWYPENLIFGKTAYILDRQTDRQTEYKYIYKYVKGFSKQRPSGPMLYISRNVRVSVCVSVCSLLRYRLNLFLPPLPKVGCPKFLEIQNPWGKVLERSGLRFEHFCFEVVLNRHAKKNSFLLILPYKTC